MNCVLFFALSAYLSWASFGTGTGDDLSAFLSFPGVFGNMQGWSRNHTPLRLNKIAARTRILAATHRHHSNALGRTRFFLSKKKTHKTIRMIMVERETKGGLQHPRSKKRTAWLPAIFRRAEQGGHSFVTTDDDDDFDFLTNNSGFISLGRV
jgi:hypothetical protein